MGNVNQTTRETFAASVRTDLHRVDLNHTASAHLIGDASESKPRPKPKGSPLRRAIGGAYWQGVLTGGFFVAAVATVAVLSFLAGVFS